MDNRDIVPYSPWLCAKYASHINVEHCASIRSVKYLFKYSYKGHDRAALEMGCDEIQQYIDARYIGAPEGAWRSLGFDMQGRSHAVVRLAVHLENEHDVMFIDGGEEEARIEGANASTTLTAWMQYNTDQNDSRHLHYAEFPKFFRWHRDTKIWTRRVHGPDAKVLGRIHAVPPGGDGTPDRFYLYLCLLHVAGARNFTDLRTVAGTVCATFREAAELMGLTASDTEYHIALQEAAETRRPRSLRRFFADLLIHCEIAEPAALWKDCKDHRMQDFVRDLGSEVLAQSAPCEILQSISNNAACAFPIFLAYLN